MDLSAPRITEEGAPSSLSVDNLIAEEEILSSLSVENFSDLSVLSERLKEIELLEKIELAEHRLRSLQLSQLSSRPSDEINNVMSEMARSTRMMAQFQGKAAEKDSNENSKLVGLNTGDIMQFLSSFNRKSCQPVYCQVSVKTRKALALTLGVPIGTTLESFYGEELGPEVPFIRDLKALVEGRRDRKPKEILCTFCMKDKAGLDRTELMDMLASCQEVVTYHAGVFIGFSLEECKETVVSNIRPLSFRVIITDYASRYMNPAFTFKALVSLIVSEFDDELFVTTRTNSRGIDNIANNAKFDEPRVKLTAQERMIKMTCYNCGKTGHSATICPVNCKFHNKKCSDKMACYRADCDAKKANLAVTDNAVANVSEMKSSTTVEANCFTVSSPRMNETDEVGLLDTGCNVLCMPKESTFGSLVKLNNSKFIKVADGKHVSIKGKGFIRDVEAHFVPDFPTGLIPDTIFSPHSIGIIDTVGIHIIPRLDSNIECVDRLLISNQSKNTITTLKKVNGLYPVSL